MSTSDLSHPETRQAVVEAAQALFANGVMSHSGHANLSARVDEQKMLLTVEGQVRGLGPDRLALVGPDGTVLEGDLDPTNAEIVAMHSEVYRVRPQVGGIIHTHSPHLLAFAMANRPLPCRYEALLRFGQAAEVPVVPWAPRGSERSVGDLDALGNHPATQALLPANHGVLVFGQGPKEAASPVTVLKEAAEVICLAVAQVLLRYNDERHWLRAPLSRVGHLFPRLLSQSAYNRRLRGAVDLMKAALRWLADHTPGLSRAAAAAGRHPRWRVASPPSPPSARNCSATPATATRLPTAASTGAPSSC